MITKEQLEGERKRDRFADEILKYLPSTFRVACVWCWWIHEFHCNIWDLLNGVPKWEVRWGVEDINDMGEAKDIARYSIKAINRKIEG